MCNLNLKEAQYGKPKEKRPREVREKQSVKPNEKRPREVGRKAIGRTPAGSMRRNEAVKTT